MTRKILVSIIAIVMIVGVIGGCFALYYTKGADKEVSISTHYEKITMTIKDGANSAEQGTITFDAISPEVTQQENHAVKTVDITLAAAPSSLFDSIDGKFTASLTGDLATYITATATLLDGAEGDPIASNSDITAAAFGSGYVTALSQTPKYVRLTFSLNEAAIENFLLAAEKTASLSLTWEGMNIWTYSDDYYYVVGTLSGANKWDVNKDNRNTTLALTGETPVIATGVATFANGDAIKVMKGTSIWVNSWSSAVDGYFYNSDGQIYFTNAGTYRIDVKHCDDDGHGGTNYDYFEITKVD